MAENRTTEKSPANDSGLLCGIGRVDWRFPVSRFRVRPAPALYCRGRHGRQALRKLLRGTGDDLVRVAIPRVRAEYVADKPSNYCDGKGRSAQAGSCAFELLIRKLLQLSFYMA
jgi:hypothetical protein